MDISTYLQNKRVLGSLLVGFGLVAGSYVLTNFGANRATIVTPAAVVAAPVRNYIEVKDSTGDGVEDWREDFISREPVVLPTPETSQKEEFVPSTITEATSVQFLQNIMQSKAGYGVRSTDEIIETTVERVADTVVDDMYTTRDVITVANTADNVRTYANAVAASITTHDVPDYEDELTIIDRALRTNNPADIQKLLPLENMYRNIRDDLLALPVPRLFAQQHLDLINIFNALYVGNRDIRLVFDDPIVALMRTKRFNTDTVNLAYALQNLYLALEPYATLFTADDPAVLLVRFAPNFNRQ